MATNQITVRNTFPKNKKTARTFIKELLISHRILSYQLKNKVNKPTDKKMNIA